jgi:hypothetical protein
LGFEDGDFVEGGVEGGVAGEKVGAGAADDSSSCFLSALLGSAYM